MWRDDYVSYHDNLRQEGVGTFSFLYLYEKGVDQITKIQATEHAPAQILGYEIPVNTLQPVQYLHCHIF